MKKFLSMFVIAGAMFASIGCDDAKKEGSKPASKAEVKKEDKKEEKK